MSQIDSVAKAYVAMISNASNHAENDLNELTSTAHKRSSEANVDSSLLTHVKAIRAHNRAALAWKGIDDKMSDDHSTMAERHFDTMTKMIPDFVPQNKRSA